MSARYGSVQQQPRRTPLSLSSSVKPMKPNDKSDNNKNDNNKKETTNNQKTDNLKKDSQQDKKFSADKKQPSTESNRSSSTSSSDSKKLENSKNQKNDDKKSQNGVNGNSMKEKPNTNEAGGKAKAAESSSNGNTSKKDLQKPTEKKAEEATTKNDNKDKSADKTKTTKTEDNKDKSADKTKTTKTEDNNKNKSNPPKLDQDDVKSVVEKKNNDEKVNEETNIAVKSTEDTQTNQGMTEPEIVIISLLDTTEKEQSLIEKTIEQSIVIQTTPIKEKPITETPNQEKPAQEESEDVEMMEPLQVNEGEESPRGATKTFAVSTPAKVSSPLHLFEGPSKLSPKSEIKPPREAMTHTPDRKSCPRTFSAISGRRSIRPIGDYTFSGNLQIRESYRKINTELDFTSSSMNVTVGSEVPNNESFSFFSRSRKRDRSSPSHQSSLELQPELSPKSPKRAKIDIGMTGFFNAMSSPIAMLRARLARASVQSTPKKQIMDSVEKEIVENVSAIVVDEDLTATEEQTFNNPDSTVADTNEQCGVEPVKCSPEPVVEENYDDIKIKETITATGSQAKKRCSIM